MIISLLVQAFCRWTSQLLKEISGIWIKNKDKGQVYIVLCLDISFNDKFSREEIPSVDPQLKLPSCRCLTSDSLIQLYMQYQKHRQTYLFKIEPCSFLFFLFVFERKQSIVLLQTFTMTPGHSSDLKFYQNNTVLWLDIGVFCAQICTLMMKWYLIRKYWAERWQAVNTKLLLHFVFLLVNHANSGVR